MRYNRSIQFSRQRGFAGVVFLVIALIAVVMSAVALMSRNNTSGVSDQTAKTNAAVILKQVSDIKTGFDRMLIDGKPASTITFDTTANTGLFATGGDTTYAVLQVPPGSAMAPSATPLYKYNKLVQLPGIGAATTDDYVIVLGGITQQTCQQINKILYNDLSTATPATTAGTLANWYTTPAAVDDHAVVVTNYAGRPEGCVINGTDYIYYKALAEN